MMASQPILVPLDGSSFSEQAIPVASSIASRWHAPLRLARVHVPLAAEVHCADGLVVVDDQRDVDGRARDAAYLDRHRVGAGDVSIETALLSGHGVSASLAVEAKKTRARLIVMATHARSGFHRFWLGSVADTLVKCSPSPVLLVHPSGERPRERFERVLVPLDDTVLARSILRHVSRLAEPRARLTLLTVIEPPARRAGAAEAQAPTGGERAPQDVAWLEDAAGPLRDAGFQVETRVAFGRRRAEEILAVARQLDADLIALATHGRSGLARAALGSVADEVVRGSPVPVLLHHPREEETRPDGDEGEAR